MKPSKPIQIAVSLTRGSDEQHGQQDLVVLLEDGRIYERRESESGYWQEIKGPWMHEQLGSADPLYIPPIVGEVLVPGEVGE